MKYFRYHDFPKTKLSDLNIPDQTNLHISFYGKYLEKKRETLIEMSAFCRNFHNYH